MARNAHGHGSPQGSHFPLSPDSLQSMSARSAPSSGYGGSHSTQPMPPLSTNFGHYEQPPRPTTMGTSHAYSRSSPSVGLDPRYTAFSHTPESSRFPSASNSKHFSHQTPISMTSHSPLALADIRPQPELHMSEDLSSPGTMLRQEPGITQTNSCYVAPWAIYAFDWCNWPVNSENGAGKMAICSYLEDPHNFVS